MIHPAIIAKQVKKAQTQHQERVALLCQIDDEQQQYLLAHQGVYILTYKRVNQHTPNTNTFQIRAGSRMVIG
jgi:hypothetical protein